jgi:hypothetical protein
MVDEELFLLSFSLVHDVSKLFAGGKFYSFQSDSDHLVLKAKSHTRKE